VPARRPTRPAALVATGVAVAVLLAGCVDPVHQTTLPRRDATAPPSSAPGGAERFYGQQVAWEPCAEADECAQVEVPLDWADPAGESVEIAVARVRADDEAVGSILVNPGGPGSSAIDFLASARLIVSPEVRDEYDLVAFDPRGVARSTPVTCLDGPGLDELFGADFDVDTDAGLAEQTDAWAAFGEACAANTGAVLGHIDTVTAARDMDVVRAVVGDQALNYLGYSYGTKLGATYAALFADTVGRVVLDSALDPRLDSDEMSAGQAVGFENALRAYVTDCLDEDGDCPLTGSLDSALGQIRTLLDRARANPLPTTSGRRLTAQLAFTGIAYPLYSQASWPNLTAGLRSGLAGDGTALLALADAYADRDGDGEYVSNTMVAFNAISCLDLTATTDVAQMRADAAEIVAAAPTVGRFFSYTGSLCARWPVPAVGGLDDYTAAGAAPILVLGTTNDPATPFVWAQALADLLESAVLITHVGEGHGVYGLGSACARAAVDDYFLDGTVPAEGTTC